MQARLRLRQPDHALQLPGAEGGKGRGASFIVPLTRTWTGIKNPLFPGGGGWGEGVSPQEFPLLSPFFGIAPNNIPQIEDPEGLCSKIQSFGKNIFYISGDPCCEGNECLKVDSISSKPKGILFYPRRTGWWGGGCCSCWSCRSAAAPHSSLPGGRGILRGGTMRRHNDTKQGNCVPRSGFSLSPGGGGSDRLSPTQGGSRVSVARIGFKLGKCRAFEEQKKSRASGVPNGFGGWGPPTPVTTFRWRSASIKGQLPMIVPQGWRGLDGGVVC